MANALQSDFSREIIRLDEVTSTNDYAKELAGKPGTKNGTVILAKRQTKGRGRISRFWESEMGTGIYMSVILYPDLRPMLCTPITLITAMAVSRALSEKTSLDVKIKWPNDLLINDKKLCGILTENSINGQKTEFLVVGIGVNVNNASFPEQINATSLYLETGNTFDLDETVEDILRSFEIYYKKFLKSAETQTIFGDFKDEYLSKSHTIGRDVKYILDGKEQQGKAVDIDFDGRLIVVDQNGNERAVYWSE